MVDRNNFTSKDVENLVKLLNSVAKTATFKLSTDEAINYVKLLNWAQVELLPKVEAHILEIKALHEAPEAPKSKAKK